MQSGLLLDPFSEARLADVQSFDCGSQPWETEVSDWIKGGPDEDSALADIAAFGTKVWLYRNAGGEIVGFGSLGTTRWKWPNPTDPRTEIAIIPHVAIATRFQGMPSGVPKDEKFSRQIMSHLIHEAKDTGKPAVGLFVHPQNVKAISLYSKLNFLDFGEKNGYRMMYAHLQ